MGPPVLLCGKEEATERGASLCYVGRINLRGFLFDTQKILQIMCKFEKVVEKF